MLVTIERQKFHSMDDESLIWACIEPTIGQIRGRDYLLKHEVYGKLNKGQQALLMFQILRGHSAYGADEFFTSLSYALSDEGFWKQLKNGMLYFGGSEMAGLIDAMKEVYPGFSGRDSEDHSAITPGEYQEIKTRINNDLKEILLETVKLVSSYIRSHPDEFSILVD